MIDREQIRLGERLRAQRTALGLTQEKAAERSGLHPGTLKRIEAGHVNLTIASLLALAVAYGVGLHELFTDDDAAKKRASKTPS